MTVDLTKYHTGICIKIRYFIELNQLKKHKRKVNEENGIFNGTGVGGTDVKWPSSQMVTKFSAGSAKGIFA